jgi:hypothetical protein
VAIASGRIVSAGGLTAYTRMKTADWLDVAALTGLDRNLPRWLKNESCESAFAVPYNTFRSTDNDSCGLSLSEQDSSHGWIRLLWTFSESQTGGASAPATVFGQRPGISEN